MRKSLVFAFSILILFVHTAVFSQTENAEPSSYSIPLLAAAQLDSSNNVIGTSDNFYMILNGDETGVLFKDGYISRINWTTPDEETFQASDRLGYTYDGVFIEEGYLALTYKDTTYLFADAENLPIMNLAPAQWASGLKPYFFIEDKNIRNQIGTEKIAEINDKAAAISERYGTDIHIIIVSDFLDYSYSNDIELFSEEIADGYRLGDRNEENALLLVMSMADRDYDIYASGINTNAIFNPYSRGFLEDAMLPHFKGNNWAEGFLAYLDECNELLEMAENGEIFEDTSTTGYSSFISNEERNYKLEIVISLIIGLLVGLIAKSGVKAAYNNQVKQESTASNYIVDNSFKLSVKNDVFTHTTTSRTYSPRSSSSSSHSGGGSRSSSHSSGKF